MLAGCASTYSVTVDSLAKPGAEQKISYALRNPDPLLAEDSLRYKEAADFVKTALSGKGLYEAPPKTTPDLVVDLAFGIAEPETRREMKMEPIYRNTPATARTVRSLIGYNEKGQPVYQTTTVDEPAISTIEGYREVMVTSTVYEKYLRLTARENTSASEGRPPPEIWTVDITSEGESRDMRKHLPILVAASIDHIGKDSHGQKTIRLKDIDADVAFVKKGL